MQLVRANGIEIACEITGNGPPLVLCHGGEGDHRNFYNFAPLLAEAFTVISYDQRDTGDTRNGTATYTLTDLGKDVGALIEALGYERAHVFGTSYGGVIAQHAVINCPERLDRLILSATWPGGEKHVTEEFIALAMAPKTTDEKHAYWKYFFSPDFVRTHPNQFVSRMEKVITNRSSEQRARRGAQGAFAHDARDRLPSVTNRTLVLAGGEDRIVLPKCGPQLAALIPNARFVVLEGVGHANTIEAPERVADVVRRFLLEP